MLSESISARPASALRTTVSKVVLPPGLLGSPVKLLNFAKGFARTRPGGGALKWFRVETWVSWWLLLNYLLPLSLKREGVASQVACAMLSGCRNRRNQTKATSLANNRAGCKWRQCGCKRA